MILYITTLAYGHPFLKRRGILGARTFVRMLLKW